MVKTIWGEMLDKNNVLQEYPRPQMVRESYLNLNGEWDYTFSKSETVPECFSGKIIVPFSPESELSGVGKSLPIDEYLWYERCVILPEGFNKGRVILHFGAVDQDAVVFVNGIEVGSHEGGYAPFSFDITDALGEENIINVRARDVGDSSYHSRGKQKTKRGGIWYTNQSGIWQTVWMESVPEQYISALKITPDFDASKLEVIAVSGSELDVSVSAYGKNACGKTNEPITIDMEGFEEWTPENPKLYDLSVKAGEDNISSYFGMRKFSVDVDDKGVKRLFLNNRPYFHTGLLDQGYYIDGLYTPPSDEAMIFDIEKTKEMGFNMLRKHIKIEPMRWYYHCDRLGMLVWQDMINGGEQYNPLCITVPVMLGNKIKDTKKNYKFFARGDERGRAEYVRELAEMIDTLYNCVCIGMWVPFNEGWGQFDAVKAVELIKSKDTTRTIDHASGWHDQQIGDIRSLHVYFRKYRHKKDKLGRAVVLSEFGGYNLRCEGHCFNEEDYGYSRSLSAEELFKNYKRLYEEEIIPAKEKGLCATVYTQLTDVEDELNGLITYDRKVTKIPVEEVAKLNEHLRDK